MRVNSAFKGILNSRLVMGSGIMAVTLAIFLIASSFTRRTNRDMRAKQTNLIIRQIGHELLLHSGDRTTTVSPVTETKEGTFVIMFEHEFVFSHDSLMMLSQRLLTESLYPSGYTVTVHDCTKAASIVYGFQINRTTPDILACNGRSQPTGCYIMEFTFPDFYETTYDYPIIGLVGLLLFSGAALLIGRFGKSLSIRQQQQDNVIIDSAVPEMAPLGKFLFDVKGHRLLLNSEVTSLTEKECRILELLYASFGQLTPRETLMQVWVNEGVITGRSLDMFVSKLRKKLSGDPELSITNVHGKGYKLEIRN